MCCMAGLVSLRQALLPTWTTHFVWEVCGKCVGSVWKVCGKCVATVWQLCGKCVASVWVVRPAGCYRTGLWQNQHPWSYRVLRALAARRSQQRATSNQK